MEINLGKSSTLHTFNEKTQKWERTEIATGWRDATPEEEKEIEEKLRKLEDEESDIGKVGLNNPRIIKEFELTHISINSIDRENGNISLGVGGYIKSKNEEK